MPVLNRVAILLPEAGMWGYEVGGVTEKGGAHTETAVLMALQLPGTGF